MSLLYLYPDTANRPFNIFLIKYLPALNAAKVFRLASDSWRCVLFTSIQKLQKTACRMGKDKDEIFLLMCY